MSKRFPQFPFFAEDFLSGCRTAGMEPELVGVYIQFLCVNWMSGGPIEADPDKLKNALGFGRKTINKLIPRLVEMGKISFGAGMLWNERTQDDVMKYQGKEARKAPLADADPMPAVRAIFAPKIAHKSSEDPTNIADKSPKDPPKIRQRSPKDRGYSGDLPEIFSEKPNDNNVSGGHTRASTSTSTSNLQGGEESPSTAREASASPSSGGLFSLDEQGAGLVRNGSMFKWLDPATGESRRLTFQFVENMAPSEPKEIIRDFAENELLAAIESGKSGGLHGLLRHAIDKGRLAAFKRRRRAPAMAGDDFGPPSPPPITEGSWD